MNRQLVMDNASYHSQLKRSFPTTRWKKIEINFLKEEKEPLPTKPILLGMVKKLNLRKE